VLRLQTHDGPGLRTTVFMKGCSLRCAWCHNPESLSGAQQVWHFTAKCIGCGACQQACPSGAIAVRPGGLEILRDRCTGCARCVAVCPARAMEALRTEWTPDSLMDLIRRDLAFLSEGGGVTFSGGEPALQAPFVAEVLKRCRAAGLHTALDTCGAVDRSAYDQLLPHCNLVLFDLKLADSEAHQRWTGQPNGRILENLRHVAETAGQRPDLELWVRTPLIPGATATPENVGAAARLLRDLPAGSVSRWELCSFNNLCADKYSRLGSPWCFTGEPLLQRSCVSALRQQAAAESGLQETQVHLRGRWQDG